MLFETFPTSGVNATETLARRALSANAKAVAVLEQDIFWEAKGAGG